MRPTKLNFKRILPLALAVVLALSGCNGRAAEKHEKQLFAMDTVMFLTAYGGAGEAALDAAADVIHALAADLDPEAAAGSVHHVNVQAGEAVPVSEDCYAVLETAMDVWRDTGGALDVALYPIIQAWGFTTEEYRVPSQSELDALLAAKQTDAIVLDETDASDAAPDPAVSAVVYHHTVTIPEGTSISLGSVAKGYAAQKAVEAMAAAGTKHAILSLGGNVQTLGETRPDGKSWQVAVTDPKAPDTYVGTLSVGQTAVVTSGGYQRYFEKDGKTYIHIIDPATGHPVDNDLLSVTVVTADGARADALSTALFVMGAEDALGYYREHADQMDLVLITKDDRVIVTAGLEAGFTQVGEGYSYEYYSG